MSAIRKMTDYEFESNDLVQRAIYKTVRRRYIEEDNRYTASILLGAYYYSRILPPSSLKEDTLEWLISQAVHKSNGSPVKVAAYLGSCGNERATAISKLMNNHLKGLEDVIQAS